MDMDVLMGTSPGHTTSDMLTSDPSDREEDATYAALMRSSVRSSAASSAGSSRRSSWSSSGAASTSGGPLGAGLAVGRHGQPAAAAAAGGQLLGSFQAGVFADPGPRESMEDRHILLPGFGAGPGAGSSRLGGAAAQAGAGPGSLLAAVFDGHRGWEMADFAAIHMPRLLQLAGGRGVGPAAALREAFAVVDAAFYREWQVEQHSKAARGRMAERFPGCTALVALLAGGRLTVANAGDSRAVLCRGGVAVAVSRDHTAAAADERARVQAAGGSVAWHAAAGGWRVGPAALQVTRSLGDFDLKVPAAATAAAAAGQPLTAGGLTSDPELLQLAIQPEDDFLVLATDGLWDVCSEAEVIGLVHDTVRQPELASKRLVMEALARGSRDNVTALVVFFDGAAGRGGDWGRVYARGGAAPPAVTPTFYGTLR